MLGTVCFRLCSSRKSSQQSSRQSLSPASRSSFPVYSRQVLSHSYASPSLSRNLALACQHDATLHKTSSCFHTSQCVEEGSEVNCATIWHELLPSHHPSILDQNTFSILKRSFETRCCLDFLPWNRSILPCKDQGLGKLTMATSLVDGSWNAAWDARPARWLQGRHSVWLLFGVRTCFSVGSAPSHVRPRALGQKILADSITHVHDELDSLDAVALKSLHGKQVYTDYSVTGIPSDGRCLFRAIAHAACLRNAEPAPSEALQQELADDLRSKVVNELINRRSESEWYIEEDFDTYVKRMREPYVWGGEPELLMASRVLKVPITVLFYDQSSKGLISIADYGKEYGSENPITILYHGFGHYDAVHIARGSS